MFFFVYFGNYINFLRENVINSNEIYETLKNDTLKVSREVAAIRYLSTLDLVLFQVRFSYRSFSLIAFCSPIYAVVIYLDYCDFSFPRDAW